MLGYRDEFDATNEEVAKRTSINFSLGGNRLKNITKSAIGCKRLKRHTTINNDLIGGFVSPLISDI